MYVVRETFIAKPGQASKLAKLFKKAFNDPHMRVMTDAVGEYNTVVMEMQVASFADFDKQMEDYRTGKAMQHMSPELKEEMSKYAEMYLTGKREIFRVEQ